MIAGLCAVPEQASEMKGGENEPLHISGIIFLVGTGYAATPRAADIFSRYRKWIMTESARQTCDSFRALKCLT